MIQKSSLSRDYMYICTYLHIIRILYLYIPIVAVTGSIFYTVQNLNYTQFVHTLKKNYDTSLHSSTLNAAFTSDLRRSAIIYSFLAYLTKLSLTHIRAS